VTDTLIQLVVTLLGGGGIVAYLNHRLQHRIAVLQQQLEERRLNTERSQQQQEFGLQSMKEVLEVRDRELQRLRAELEHCRAEHQDTQTLQRDHDLLAWQLRTAHDEIRAWKEREIRYQAIEQDNIRLERQNDQRRWKEDLILQRVERVMHDNRQLRLETRRLRQQAGIPTEDTAELPALALIGDVRAFLGQPEDPEAPDRDPLDFFEERHDPD
jgi:hypothetical protein